MAKLHKKGVNQRKNCLHHKAQELATHFGVADKGVSSAVFQTNTIHS